MGQHGLEEREKVPDSHLLHPRTARTVWVREQEQVVEQYEEHRLKLLVVEVEMEAEEGQHEEQELEWVHLRRRGLCGT